ncbi:MAG: T9SS type A sorting domain-containing protein [Bacteroidales bacterium]
MKKLLLLSMALSLTVCAFSQTRARISNALRNKSVERVYTRPSDEVSSILSQPANQTVSRAFDPDETQLGTTFYDNQTNASLSNRFYRHTDGTMAFVWTRGMTATAYADRGSGYNYFDGTNWGPEPTSRVENLRTGWPSYAPLGANGEIIICHDANDLQISSRPQKGTGTWTQTPRVGPTGTSLSWPRVITDGPDHNIIHLFCNSYNAYLGQAQALLYSRSQDGGATWDIDNQIIPGTGSDSYTEISADVYVWAEPRANTLAFVCGSPWIDLFLMKSTDNGDNWTKTVIWENPYPFFDFASTLTTDTIWAPESVSVALDASGKAHVAFGIGRVAHPEATTTYSFWPYTDGVGYWNEDMPPFTNENQHKALCTDPGFLVENVNYIGWAQDMDSDGTLTFIDPLFSYNPQIGISTMPNITVDENNDVVVAYASLMENYDNTIFNYKHIWMRASSDGGETWRNFMDLTSSPIHAFDECIWPLLSANCEGDNIYVVYNADDSPGITLNTPPDHDPQENRQNFAVIPKTDLINVNINTPLAKNMVELSEIYPNPCQDNAHVSITLAKAANVRISLQNLLGQEVLTQDIALQAGARTVQIDVNKLNAGVYFYTVKAGDTKVSKKMVVK